MSADRPSGIVPTVQDQQPHSLVGDATSEDLVSKPPRSLRPVGAAFLSAVLPGVGHLLVHRWQTGFCLIACYAMLLVCFWPLRLLRFYGGFLALFSAWIILFLYATCSAQLSRDRQTSKRPSPWWFLATLPVALVALSLSGAAVTRAAGFRSFEVPSTAMEPTIQRGDRIVTDTFEFRSRRPRRPDVIIFKRDGIFFLKRVIGIDGETVEVRDKSVFVNGTLLNESYIQHTQGNISGNVWMDRFGPTTVPAGKYFVMGDNRDVSLDSRSPDFGLVEESTIIGKALYIYSSDRQGANIQ